jgi:hypothetical protein
MERLSSASFPSRSIVALISSFLGVILHLNGFGLIFNPSLLCYQHLGISTNEQQYSRITKYVNRDVVPRFIEGFLNVESPQQSGNTDKGSLLSKCLTCTDTSSPSKRHVPTLVGKRPMILAIL